MHYSNSVKFIELLRIICIYGDCVLESSYMYVCNKHWCLLFTVSNITSNVTVSTYFSMMYVLYCVYVYKQ